MHLSEQKVKRKAKNKNIQLFINKTCSNKHPVIFIKYYNFFFLLIFYNMSANKRKNLNAMEEDPSGSDSETSSDDEDDGPHPDAYTGNEVSTELSLYTINLFINI